MCLQNPGTGLYCEADECTHTHCICKIQHQYHDPCLDVHNDLSLSRFWPQTLYEFFICPLYSSYCAPVLSVYGVNNILCRIQKLKLFVI